MGARNGVVRPEGPCNKTTVKARWRPWWNEDGQKKKKKKKERKE